MTDHTQDNLGREGLIPATAKKMQMDPKIAFSNLKEQELQLDKSTHHWIHLRLHLKKIKHCAADSGGGGIITILPSHYYLLMMIKPPNSREVSFIYVCLNLQI